MSFPIQRQYEINKDLSEQIYPKFDSHDLSNDLAAIEFLKNSVNEELWNEVQLRTSPTDPFVIVYLNLVQLVITTNAAKFNKLKAKLRTMVPSHFPKEDIFKFSTETLTIWETLNDAQQWDWTLLQDIVRGLLKVSTKGTVYNNELLIRSKKVSKQVNLVAYMTTEEAEVQMDKEGLYVNQILIEATENYKESLDDDEWEAASLPTPSKVPPATYLTEASLLALLQNGPKNKKTARDKSNDTCFNCGKLGHHASECPNKKKTNKHQSSWKKTPPKVNESETKKVKGTTFYWRNKCKRWTTTHSTAQHHDKKDEAPNQHNASLNQAELDTIHLDHSVWMMETSNSSTPCSSSLWYFVALFFILVNASLVLINDPLTLLMNFFKFYWHFLISNGLVIIQVLAPIF